jgi:hypothetical protein
VRPAPGIEIPGDHNTDRLHPTGDVEHRIQAALGEDLIVFGVSGTARRVLAGLFDPQEFETLIVLVSATRHWREIIATAAGKGGRSRIARPALPAAALGPARTALARSSLPAAAGSALTAAASASAPARLTLALTVGAGGVAGTSGWPATVAGGQGFVVAVVGDRWACVNRVVAVTINRHAIVR